MGIVRRLWAAGAAPGTVLPLRWRLCYIADKLRTRLGTVEFVPFAVPDGPAPGASDGPGLPVEEQRR